MSHQLDQWKKTQIVELTAPGAKIGAHGARHDHISIIKLALKSLAEAEELLVPSENDDAETVLREGRVDGVPCAQYERIVRFADPVDGSAIQQCVRLVEFSGRVRAFTLTTEAKRFNAHYESFKSVIAQTLAEETR